MRRARILLATLAMLVPAVPLLGVSVDRRPRRLVRGPARRPLPQRPAVRARRERPAGATWDAEDWYLYGCVTTGTAPLSSDPQGASGMSVSDLWNRAVNPQRGRDDVTVAYVEGGINWRIPTSCELKDRAQLNTGELPYPEDANGHTKPYLAAQGQVFANTNPYDLNNDGVVNVEDYVNDPRVLRRGRGPAEEPRRRTVPPPRLLRASGPGYSDITPEDLIVAFGHCQVSQRRHRAGGLPAGGRFDNDHNGYPNDINGWNFNRDNNDPQTEQSVYAHFTDELAQPVGEGNNANASIGMCPLCRYVPIKAGDEAIDRPDRVAEAIVYAANIGINVLDVTSASLGLNQTRAGRDQLRLQQGHGGGVRQQRLRVGRPHRRHVLRARVAGQLDHRRPLDAQPARPAPARRTAPSVETTPPTPRDRASPRTALTRSSRCPTTTAQHRPEPRHRRAWPRWWSPRAWPPLRAARSPRR